MKKLLIINPIISAAGVQRFLFGLIEGIQIAEGIDDWEIHLLIPKKNSAGINIIIPESIDSHKIQIKYIRDNNISTFFDKLSSTGNIFNIPGTSKFLRLIPKILSNHAPSELRKFAGDVTLWIQDFCIKDEYDLAYFCYPYFFSCPKLDIPIACTPHDFNYKRFSTFDSKTREQIENQMPDWLKFSKSIIVSSEFISSEIKLFYPEYHEKTRVIRPGIPNNTIRSTNTNFDYFDSKNKLPRNFLLITGWIVPHKNQLQIFKAYVILLQRGIQLPLVFVGPNSEQLKSENHYRASSYVQEIIRLSNKNGLKPGTDYLGLGYVEDYELQYLYRRACALIMATRYEAGSFSALEATTERCPVICSKIPSLEEQAELTGNYYRVFDPNDHIDLANNIEYVINNRMKFMKASIEANKLMRQHYSWDKAGLEYLNEFENIVNE